jgi:transposase
MALKKILDMAINEALDIWFMDECHFQQHGSRLAAWFHRDIKDPVIKHEPTRKKIGIIGAVQVKEGKLVSCEEGKFNAQSIETFFDELYKHKLENKSMVIIIDNARFHHAKALQPWLDEHKEGFALEFLPPYSPELNNIERVWKLLRRLCTHNQYFGCIEKLRQVVFEKLTEWSLPNKTLKTLCAII